MRISCQMVAAMAVISFGTCFNVDAAIAQNHPAASELVQELRSDKTTDQASKQLLQLVNSEPGVKQYLAAQLPSMIEMGPTSCAPSNIQDLHARWHSCPWYNAVEFSGKLRIAEAATALAPWIGWRAEGPFLPTLEAQLVFHPAAKALAAIGDPAIPVLQQALGNPKDDYVAVRVLCIIHTEKSKNLLQDDLAHESDPGLQTMIKNALKE
jgi:hypothetical protein